MSSYERVLDMYLNRFRGDNRKAVLLLKVCDIIDRGGSRLESLERLLESVDDASIVRSASLQADARFRDMIARMSE